MIPRILVPMNLSPASLQGGAEKPRRVSTALDARALVPQDLPVVALDGRSAIPAHLPLEVLGSRTLVPRDLPLTPLERSTALPEHVPLTVLDSRTVVPRGAQAAALEPRAPVPAGELPELVEPDVFNTGEVHLMVKPVEERGSGWAGQARISSVIFHAAMVGLVLLQPKLFPYQPPTPEQIELARRSLGMIYLKPYVQDVPQVPPPPSDETSPKIRIDPRLLQEMAPPMNQPEPLPGAKGPDSSRVVRELPSAPTPQASESEQSRRGDAMQSAPRFETPKTPDPVPQFSLPRSSPGKLLEDSLRGAARDRGSDSGGFADRVPPGPGGGGGEGYLGGNIQILTPTEGVDFTNYLARVLASVRRNWYAVIPESARLGDRGKVVIEFRILKSGTVPYPEPMLVSSSGRTPLDRAAMSSIRTSNPFEPLPPAFSGPFIALRFTFLYNMPRDAR